MGEWLIDADNHRRALDLWHQAQEQLQQGRLDLAIALLRDAVNTLPESPAMHCNLGVYLNLAERWSESIRVLRHAATLDSNQPFIWNNLSNALAGDRQTDAAIGAAERSIQIQPVQAEAFNALGNALKDQGRIDEALAAYQRGLAHEPASPVLASNRLYTSHFADGLTGWELRAMHEQWGQQLATVPRFSHSPKRSRPGRLRIGYVSPDLNDHPVARFLLPLLRCHDRSKYEIVCYQTSTKADAWTTTLRMVADNWQEVAALDDMQLASAINSDGIDILVDLSLHMRGHRLGVFARKPAPVQVTYLGYCSTSGLAAMDYRFSDPFLDPPGNEAMYVEQTLRLPSYWCYEPPSDAPPVVDPPATRNGFITFGCFNNLCKVSDRALLLWSRILNAVPNSRLLFHAGRGSHRQQLIDRLGLTIERVRFMDRLSHADYMLAHGEMDLALDSMPYCGGTTTCDALWMGVPVISRVGQTAVGRSGLSLLSNAGLGEFAAADDDAYVQLAIKSAGDMDQLIVLRQTMRDRLRSSSLMNQTRFTQDVEAAYDSIN